jgi:hypothetical protein
MATGDESWPNTYTTKLVKTLNYPSKIAGLTGLWPITILILKTSHLDN